MTTRQDIALVLDFASNLDATAERLLVVLQHAWANADNEQKAQVIEALGPALRKFDAAVDLCTRPK